MLSLLRPSGIIALLAAAVLTGAPRSLFADELSVKDTAGFTRAAAQVEANGRVQFTIVNEGGAPVDDVEVSLTNPQTGEVLRAKSVAGIVSFESVPAGVWTVATAAPGITFTDVSIITETAVLAGMGETGVVGGGIVLGGTTAAILASALISNEDDSDDVLSPAS